MNTIKKIQNINQVFIDYESDQCPYCNDGLIFFVDKKGIENKSCENHDRTLIIDLMDYFMVIKNIVKYSNIMEEPVKFKKLSEF